MILNNKDSKIPTVLNIYYSRTLTPIIQTLDNLNRSDNCSIKVFC